MHIEISIHALREEGDRRAESLNNNYFLFLSTPSARRATQRSCCHAHKIFISIHALREEGDSSRLMRSPSTSYFYPRPPRGGRPPRSGRRPRIEQFLSTPSARRATVHSSTVGYADIISIHALREEGDRESLSLTSGPFYFYPRPPRGGRLRPSPADSQHLPYFYPRPPRGGRQSFLRH